MLTVLKMVFEELLESFNNYNLSNCKCISSTQPAPGYPTDRFKSGIWLGHKITQKTYGLMVKQCICWFACILIIVKIVPFSLLADT